MTSIAPSTNQHSFTTRDRVLNIVGMGVAGGGLGAIGGGIAWHSYGSKAGAIAAPLVGIAAGTALGAYVAHHDGEPPNPFGDNAGPIAGAIGGAVAGGLGLGLCGLLIGGALSLGARTPAAGDGVMFALAKTGAITGAFGGSIAGAFMGTKKA